MRPEASMMRPRDAFTRLRVAAAAALVGSRGIIVVASLGVATAVAVLCLFSTDPGKALYFFFLSPFLDTYRFGNMLNSIVPLAFCGLGMAAAFRASAFNLGGEGQIYAGALAATVIGIGLPGLPGVVGVVFCLAGGAAAGAVLGGVSGLLKARWDVNELLSSYLVSAVVVLLVDYLITGPLDDPASNLLATPTLPPHYWLMQIMAPSHLNIGLFVVIAGGLLLSVLLFRTKWGFKLRLCGLNREFARYGGLHTGLYLLAAMAISGAYAGLAGGVAILGTYHASIKGFSAGIGWNGIAVALIGRNRPAGVFLASLLFAYLEAGAQASLLHSGVPAEVASLAQAVVFYLVTAQGLMAWLPHKGFLRHRASSTLLGRGQK